MPQRSVLLLDGSFLNAINTRNPPFTIFFALPQVFGAQPYLLPQNGFTAALHHPDPVSLVTWKASVPLQLGRSGLDQRQKCP